MKAAPSTESTVPPRLRVVAWPATTGGANPYIDQLTESLRRAGVHVDPFEPGRILAGRYDVWHVHWPDGGALRNGTAASVAGTAAVLALVAMARLRGMKVIWTAHNVQEHDRRHPRLSRLFWRSFLAQVDGIIALTSEGVRRVHEEWPVTRRIPWFVVPHGHYREAYPAPPAREVARSEWGVPAEAAVAVFVGVIRPYKNVGALIEAFRSDVLPRERALLVGGRPRSEALGDELAALAAGADDVQLHLRFLSEAEVSSIVGAGDLVVLPYAAVLNSGTALLALSLDTPVLVPHTGAMPELQAAVGEAWVRMYQGPFTAQVLADALVWAREPRPARCGLERFGWARVGEETVQAYEAVLSR